MECLSAMSKILAQTHCWGRKCLMLIRIKQLHTFLVGYVTKVFLGRQNTHVYSPQIRIPLQTKVQESSKSKLIRVGDRGRNDSKMAPSPKPIPAWITAHKARNLEHTAQPADSSTGYGSGVTQIHSDHR